MKIKELQNKYLSIIEYFDLDLIIAHALEKTREFVLIHPEYQPTKSEQQKIINMIKQRINHEPIAYILGHKEFYGLDFMVNKYTLIPRPETEMMVEQVLELLLNKSNDVVIDIGTGSGCIITSIANQAKNNMTKFYAIDISKEALKVAKKNAKINDVDKKIIFLQGNLLSPLINSSLLKDANVIIAANLPYLSKDIYESAEDNVKKFEPKSALYSPEEGLQHYRKLLEQIKSISAKNKPKAVICFLEISPEQKKPIQKLITSIFPEVKIEFTKDLAKKWRICKISL